LTFPEILGILNIVWKIFGNWALWEALTNKGGLHAEGMWVPFLIYEII